MNFKNIKTKTMEHKFHKCNLENCYLCNSELSACDICGGAEGGLTTECIGKRISYEEEQDVCKGKKDFKDGKWISIPEKKTINEIIENKNSLSFTRIHK